MATNLVLGKLKRAIPEGEIVRLSDFGDQDLIAGVVRQAEENERRIGKSITKKKLRQLTDFYENILCDEEKLKNAQVEFKKRRGKL